jgi:hypothetical protein
MTATEVLKKEHKIVLLVLNGAEREAKSIQDTNKLTLSTTKVGRFLSG